MIIAVNFKGPFLEVICFGRSHYDLMTSVNTCIWCFIAILYILALYNLVILCNCRIIYFFNRRDGCRSDNNTLTHFCSIGRVVKLLSFHVTWTKQIISTHHNLSLTLQLVLWDRNCCCIERITKATLLRHSSSFFVRKIVNSFYKI